MYLFPLIIIGSDTYLFRILLPVRLIHGLKALLEDRMLVKI